MKKLLAIMVLSLLFGVNAYGNLEDIYKLKMLGEAYKSGLITKEIFE